MVALLEAEAGGSPRLQGQPGLCSDTVSKNKTKQSVTGSPFLPRLAARALHPPSSKVPGTLPEIPPVCGLQNWLQSRQETQGSWTPRAHLVLGLPGLLAPPPLGATGPGSVPQPVSGPAPQPGGQREPWHGQRRLKTGVSLAFEVLGVTGNHGPQK